MKSCMSPGVDMLDSYQDTEPICECVLSIIVVSLEPFSRGPYITKRPARNFAQKGFESGRPNQPGKKLPENSVGQQGTTIIGQFARQIMRFSQVFCFSSPGRKGILPGLSRHQPDIAGKSWLAPKDKISEYRVW